MIWVLVGAVALFIVGFFVYIAKIKPRTREAYGALDAPGDSTIDFPAGVVEVYYEDEMRWRAADRPQVGPGFSVLISDEAGKRVDLAEPESEIIYKAGRKNRIPFGRLNLETAGTYRVVTTINEVAEKPRVTFGT